MLQGLETGSHLFVVDSALGERETVARVLLERSQQLQEHDRFHWPEETDEKYAGELVALSSHVAPDQDESAQSSPPPKLDGMLLHPTGLY
jgi:hypothetical protein